MKKRVITSVVLLPLLLAVLLVAPKILTAVVFSVLSVLAALELLYNTGLVRHLRLVAYSAVMAALVPFWCFYGMDPVVAQTAVFIFTAILFAEMMIAHARLPLETVALCYVGALLVPYMLSAVVRIIAVNNGRYLVLIPFVLAFLSDSGAYFIGRKFGRHKMAPIISPNKSMEGLFGGIVTAMVGMIIYTLIMEHGFDCKVDYGYAVFYGFAGSLAGVFGDLAFSVIKRLTGIKDYGQLIPGHGGILDRFDSVIAVAPLVELLLIWIPAVVKL